MRTFWLMLIAVAAAGSIHAVRAESEPPRTVSEPIPDDEAPAPVKVANKKEAAPTVAPAGEKAAEPVAEEVDLIADRPDAAEKKKPDLLEPIEAVGPQSIKARKVYSLIADMKTNMDLIAKDLDDNGKEVTRLLRTSDNLSKNITEMSDVWKEDEKFRDECGSAKRTVLILNDELAREPRHWAHVRWAFNDSVKEVRKLRVVARELAELEPKPEARVGKNGKVEYVEPAGPVVDPAVAERNRKIQEVNEAKAKLKREEEARKNPRLKVSLDDADN